jgi:hypothetical protein
MIRRPKFSPSPFHPILYLTTCQPAESRRCSMKCLRLLVSFLLISTPFALAQRDSHPSSAPSGSSAPASSPVPAASAPSSSSSGGGGGSSHSSSAPSSSNSGGNAGISSGRSSGGSSGGGNSNAGRSNAGGGNSRSDHGNSSNANSSRADHSNSGNNGRVDRSNNGLDRRVQDNTNSKPEATHTPGSDMRPSKQRHENSLTPNTNRENRGDVNGHSKPGPTAKPANDSERANKSHFHWFWRRSPKNPEETARAKDLRPDLKKPTPCKGNNNCKPTPVCPAGQTAGETGGCVPSVPVHGNCNGTVDANGNCLPYDPCAGGNIVSGTNCPQNAAQYQNRTDCSAASAEVGGLKNQIEILLREEQLACSQDPNAPECMRIRDELRRLQERLRMAEQRYASCMSRP